MIFKRSIGLVTVAAVFLLSGCPGLEENNIESGLTVHFAEVHLEQQLTTLAAGVTQVIASPEAAAADVSAGLVTALAISAPGGYDFDNLEHHDIVDNNSHLFSMYRMYVVLDKVELVPCSSVSQLPKIIFNSIFPAAQAHAGHGAEPVGGRSLDKPNVIDIVTQDEYILPLGDLAAAPGKYCGLRVSFSRLGADSYGKPEPTPPSSDDPITSPEVPELSGKMFALRADYCSTPDGAGGCAGRTKVDIDDSGLVIPAARTVSFVQPLELSETRRSVYVAIGIAYGNWVHDVDVSILNSDLYERQKLLNNIADSIHVYSKGLGDLPINAP